jgi:glycogen synthase
MHVLMTCDAVGGVWTYTRELVCGLLQRGHRVSLVSFGAAPRDHQLTWMQGLSGFKFWATDFPLEWTQDCSIGIAASMEYIERTIPAIQPDVLHSNQYCYGALRCSIPKIVVAHSDVLSWWSEVHGNSAPETPWLAWYRDVVAKGLAHADVVVAPSRWMLDAINQHYVPSVSAIVIYNGRDPSLFSSSLSKTNCVLSAGRAWDEGKQISLLLARRQCVPVHIAGQRQHPDRTDQWALPPGGADENVTFLGSQSEEEMLREYACSSLYAVTSRYEPFGLAAVEAALSKCVLVVNDIPVFRELWGECAVYFRRNDPDALADAIRTLSENSELRKDYAQRAWQQARHRFDSHRMVAEYEALYRQVACSGLAA